MNEQLIKLSQLSIHLVNILDKELINLQNRDCNNKIVELKTIVNIFSKIVDTIVQLQKFNKDNQIEQCDELTSEDLNIIKRFIDRHSKT
ncbi:hypothetical protein OTSGILL_0640 [Orientia tsutsugamushi str. Gilliam]|uniref:Uncharacterized protein n=3 Tax=Orientia tsutsugamushi TaxID=784 RepID=A0A0F3MCT5_ORITS|nr:hypothetical protein [Orientia tsutsugamushi]KJV85835.1 hypothetical protein OTSUT76_1665 [Orientia tsutsugamushi str. UT76]KJV53568.1 hypothetical protein OTSGILL_0640 [Orientia tsutsugamushi str. Gilliam]KJV57410.1 hypothetical protein OTSKARP_0170 [Orientia tsutsugamushi str. Karp]SPR07832.1 Uncharacterised protein [Orientia tsutsugamushi str. Gilliam]SPR10598.1 Uncharacterised protein [Orientia tsutsugamushi]